MLDKDFLKECKGVQPTTWAWPPRVKPLTLLVTYLLRGPTVLDRYAREMELFMAHIPPDILRAAKRFQRVQAEPA